MNILENLLSTLKEILYDIIGYLLPGLFILFLIYVPFKLGCFCSFMYAIYEIIFKSKVNFFVDFLSNTSTFSWITIFIIIFSSYLLGHLPTLISTLCKSMLKKINFSLKFITYEKSYKEFNINIRESLEKMGSFKKELFMSSSEKEKPKKEYNEDFLITFASTYSRFTSHNDLIQKYICKINFYNSFSCIFLMLFIDSIISGSIWLHNNSLLNLKFFILKVLPIEVFLFLFYLSFLYQYYKHKNLKTKECYLFLYEYFNNKESKKADCS